MRGAVEDRQDVDRTVKGANAEGETGRPLDAWMHTEAGVAAEEGDNGFLLLTPVDTPELTLWNISGFTGIVPLMGGVVHDACPPPPGRSPDQSWLSS